MMKAKQCRLCALAENPIMFSRMPNDVRWPP